MQRNGQFTHGHTNATPLRFGHGMATSVRRKTKLRSPPKTILVATDLSVSSRRALKHAIGLAGEASRLILLHVVPPVATGDTDLAQTMTNARQKLKQFCESDGIAALGLIKFVVRSGPPFREILDCAKENAAEMIVLGVDKSSPLGGVALGHTADRVSRYATCPVLLVREAEVRLPASSR